MRWLKRVKEGPPQVGDKRMELVVALWPHLIDGYYYWLESLWQIQEYQEWEVTRTGAKCVWVETRRGWRTTAWQTR